jgi:transposase
MLDQSTRTTILRLREEGHGTRAIARTVGVSRGAVKEVLATGQAEVPPIDRAEKAEPYREQIVELYARCRGNLVRVHEELVAGGGALSYQALTGFCRRHEIGRPPQKPAGRYHFEPGQEMQHDTSTHVAKLGGHDRRVQTASLVLAHSTMLYFQHYPAFTRFHCKVFLTDALRYFGGACDVCMIDNTHVVVLSGTGKKMIPVPEMQSFGERFGFAFNAHEKGDANRSAHVERPFHFIENNFLNGREFTDWEDLNAKAAAWCDKVNGKPRKRLHRASPRELFAPEKPRLHQLPAWVPDVYALHQRIVDIEGFVNVHGNRYSAPWRLIGRRLEVRETKDQIQIFDGPRQLAAHKKVLDALDTRVTDKTHRPPRGEGATARPPILEEEQQLLRLAPEVAEYVAGLRRHAPARGIRDVRRLLRMVQDYPRAPLVGALGTATHYGLYDLERVERLLLRSLARDFFLVPPTGSDGEPS